MALLKFLKGNYTSLSTKAISEGQILICGDTGEMFVDVAADKRVKIGDFSVVANITALEALDASAVPTSRLYYVEEGNILARSNGTSWIQINKQKTLAELGGVSLEVYNTKMTALDKADTDNATAIAGVDTRLQAAEKKLESVATTDGLAELAKAVDEHTASIDTINGDVNTAGSMLRIAKDAADAKDATIKEAKDAADKAQGDVDALAQTHATDKEALEGAIALKANSADVYTKDEIDSKVATINAAIDEKADAEDVYTKDEVDGIIDELDLAISNKIGDVDDGKTVVDMIEAAQEAATYDDEEVRGLIGANAQAITDEASTRESAISSLKTELEGKIGAKADQTALDNEITRATGIEAGLRTDVDAIKGDYLKASDKTELQGNIDTVAGAVERLTNGVSADEIDGVNDLINYVNEHGTEVTGMKEDIADNAKAIEDEAKRADEAEKALGGRIDELSGVVDTKATQSDLDDLDDRVETVEGKVSTLEGEMDAVEGRATTLEGKVEALEGAANTYALDSDLDAAVGRIADNESAIGELQTASATHATTEALNTHVNDTVKHITADERAAWNGAVSDLADHKAAYDTKVAELVAEDTDIRTAFAEADATLKTELQGYADQAELDAIAAAKTETESQVGAAKQELNGTIEGVSGALETYKTENNAAVALKADADAVYTKAEVESMLTWGDF